MEDSRVDWTVYEAVCLEQKKKKILAASILPGSQTSTPSPAAQFGYKKEKEFQVHV